MQGKAAVSRLHSIQAKTVPIGSLTGLCHVLPRRLRHQHLQRRVCRSCRRLWCPWSCQISPDLRLPSAASACCSFLAASAKHLARTAQHRKPFTICFTSQILQCRDGLLYLGFCIAVQAGPLQGKLALVSLDERHFTFWVNIISDDMLNHKMCAFHPKAQASDA